jgi:ribosomal protein L11 methyltransferase
LNWLEVSLTVNGELAEAVADVLARFAPNGVITEQAVNFINDEDEGTPVGPITVRAYLLVDEQINENRRKLEEALYYLGMIQSLPVPSFTFIDNQNWMEAWKERYQPIPVGGKLIIVPAWLESPDDTRIPIRIDPGMAFGTGTHPTTQLCLELIEQIFDGKLQARNHELSSVIRPLSSVIDIGCGSGILSIAALKLGATSALGVDIDEASIRASRENAEQNGVGDKLILGLGSVEEILAGKFPFQQAPLGVANILAPILIRLFEAGMAGLLLPGGVIILSGILQEQAESVIHSAKAKGLILIEQLQLGDWVALACQKN